MRECFITDLSEDFIVKNMVDENILVKENLINYISSLNKPFFRLYADSETFELISGVLDGIKIKEYNAEKNYNTGEFLLNIYDVEDL